MAKTNIYGEYVGCYTWNWWCSCPNCLEEQRERREKEKQEKEIQQQTVKEPLFEIVDNCEEDFEF